MGCVGGGDGYSLQCREEPLKAARLKQNNTFRGRQDNASRDSIKHRTFFDPAFLTTFSNFHNYTNFKVVVYVQSDQS